MTSLIEQLASERIGGSRLLLAYCAGILIGIAAAAAALTALT